MGRSRSFSLRRDQESVEHLYKTPNFRCFRCVALPALFCFIMLLILVNVDFEGDAYITTTRFPMNRTTSATNKFNTTSTTALPWTSKTEIAPETTKSMQKSLQRAAPPAMSGDKMPGASMTFSSLYCYADNHCNITCDGDVDNLAATLIQQQIQCGSELNVFLRRCSFPSGQMKKNFLSGSFHLRSLTIDDCDLEAIEPGAFEKPAVDSLTSLSIISAHLSELNAGTFVGMRAIKYFQLVNGRKLNTFTGMNYLAPLAATVQQIEIQQLSNIIPYDPTNWLSGGEPFRKLAHVNLSGNNFPNTITPQTFAYLVHVIRLDLSHCNIRAIASGTFDAIAGTLRLLDLSNNQLTVLDWQFLALTGSGGIPLELAIGNNIWNCECENSALLNALHAVEVSSIGETSCATPKEWQDVDMLNVQLFCDDDDTRTTAEPVQTTLYPIESSSTGALETTEDTSDSTESPYETSEYQTSTIRTTPSTTTTTQTTQTTITIQTTQTTQISTPIPTTTESPNIHVNCSPSNPLEDFFSISVRNYDALFHIETITATSVSIHVCGMSDLWVMYFTPNNTYDVRTTFFWNSPNCRYRYQKEYYVDELLSDRSYVFCLLMEIDRRTSPFNCRSHYIASNVNEPLITPWLYKCDMWWFILLCTLGLLICLLLGSGLLYWLLHWRPTWLKGCPRMHHQGKHSHLVFLLPKKSDAEADEQSANMKPTDSSGNSVCKHPGGDDYTPGFWHYHYRQLELAKMRQIRSKSQPSEFMPPVDYAPAVPSANTSRSNSKRSTCTQSFRMQTLNGIAEQPQEHDYQAVDYYEAVI